MESLYMHSRSIGLFNLYFETISWTLRELFFPNSSQRVWPLSLYLITKLPMNMYTSLFCLPSSNLAAYPTSYYCCSSDYLSIWNGIGFNKCFYMFSMRIFLRSNSWASTLWFQDWSLNHSLKVLIVLLSS